MTDSAVDFKEIVTKKVVVNNNGNHIGGGAVIEDGIGGGIVPQKRVLRVVNCRKLSVLTYNISFEQADFGIRMKQILEILRGEFDIIGLQEVTFDSYNILFGALKETYHFFQVFLKENLPYGDCILIRRTSGVKINECFYYDFPGSGMGRKLLGCELEFLDDMARGSKKFFVFNTHLETGRDLTSVRERQLDFFRKVAQNGGIENLLLIGDFNFTDQFEISEDILYEMELRDCWREAGCPSELKYTHCGRTTKMAVNGRVDRIYFKFRDSEAVVTKIRLLGIGNSTTLPPSDHFGLYTELLLR
jgi:endonuclease/exonuclease/phosphatase family metal-dependent hydrolase